MREWSGRCAAPQIVAQLDESQDRNRVDIAAQYRLREIRYVMNLVLSLLANSASADLDARAEESVVRILGKGGARLQRAA